jgi:hypothetical protein
MRLGSVVIVSGVIASGLLAAAVSRAQPAAPARNAIENLQHRLDSGELRLQHDERSGGYLPAVLKALQVPVDSQVLVFSKTSLQFMRISPKAPRAIYFNDDTAVGSVQGGGLIEIMTTGVDGKVAFYTLDAAPSVRPEVHREGAACVACHAAADPWAPGLLVANVLPYADGTPVSIEAARMFDLTDATTPFERRWGGWYVTGEHGAMHHNGNVQITQDTGGGLPQTQGLNVTDLSSRFDVGRYLAPTSDIVALMTLEHQIGVINRIWRLEAQLRALDGEGSRKPTAADVDESVDALVATLLGVGEAPLPSPVKGAAGFTQSFAARGPRDSRGRSLRDFDLQSRLFRYPVSYMVYSRAFDGLRPAVRDRVYRRMFDVLSGADGSEQFAMLLPQQRQAALEILRETKPALPTYWRSQHVRADAAR